MQSSAQWWKAIKNDKAAFIDWLQKQYHGEITSVDRLKSFLRDFGNQAIDYERKMIELIIKQEAQHAEWVAQCLKTRGVDPRKLDKPERYWDKTLPSVTSFRRGCAVAAHAEAMRLERLKVIAGDITAPFDIKTTFERILGQEQFHAEQFKRMGSSEMDSTAKSHAAGLEVLGLVI